MIHELQFQVKEVFPNFPMSNWVDYISLESIITPRVYYDHFNYFLHINSELKCKVDVLE